MEFVNWIKGNKASIMAGAAGACAVMTGIFAADGSIKAVKILEEKHNAKFADISDKKAVLKELIKQEAGATICGLGTLLLIFFSDYTHTMQSKELKAALASLTALYFRRLQKESKLRTEEGKTVFETISKQFADEAIRFADIPPRPEEDEELDLFYDALTHQFFWSNQYYLTKAELEFNKILHDYDNLCAGASLNDWCRCLREDIFTEELSSKIRWTMDCNQEEPNMEGSIDPDMLRWTLDGLARDCNSGHVSVIYYGIQYPDNGPPYHMIGPDWGPDSSWIDEF